MAFAGLDIGTSGCKMVVYRLDGEVLYEARRAYEELGNKGYREINPGVVLQDVKETIRDAAIHSPEPIEAFAIAALGESAVCLDEDGNSLCNSMITGDKRGIEETEKLIELVDKEEIMDITGLPASEMYSLPKFMWMNENTEVFQKARYILFYEDFIGYVLTGRRMVSYSSASRSMAFDIEKKRWSEKLLKIAGISPEQMSKPVPSGTILGKVKKSIARELNLPEDTVIAAGGHDQNCAALGGGVTAGNQGEDGRGTCEVMLMLLPKLLKTKYMMDNDLVCVPYIFPDTYLTYVEITTCGILMNWSRDTIFQGIREECRREGKNFFRRMDEMASGTVTDLLVLPQFGSSGNPNVNYDAKGLIWGLTIHTRPEEIYLAIEEGMAFQMKLAYETLKPLDIDLDCVSVTGGGAASSLILQMRADIFNKEMVTLRGKEAGTLGCMVIAAAAVGRYGSFREGVQRAVKIDKKYMPDPKRHKYYMEKYEQYKRLYKRMYNFK